MQTLTLIAVLLAGASAQFFPQQELSLGLKPPPLQQQQQFVAPQPQFVTPQQFAVPQQQFNRQFVPQQQQLGSQPNYVHRAVVQNAALESQLPVQFQNPFYKNQKIANALAKESWFTPGENLVVDREAEKIPRQKIFAVLKHAGFINRRRR